MDILSEIQGKLPVIIYFDEANYLRERTSDIPAVLEWKHQLDFAYQHLGKCLMEMLDADAAENHLQMALQLRMKKGNQTLIDSTLDALRLNRQLKERSY